MKVFNPLTDTLHDSERLRLRKGKLFVEPSEHRKKMSFFGRLLTRREYSQRCILNIFKEKVSESHLSDVEKKQFFTTYSSLVSRGEAQNRRYADRPRFVRFVKAKLPIGLIEHDRLLNSYKLAQEKLEELPPPPKYTLPPCSISLGLTDEEKSKLEEALQFIRDNPTYRFQSNITPSSSGKLYSIIGTFPGKPDVRFDTPVNLLIENPRSLGMITTSAKVYVHFKTVLGSGGQRKAKLSMQMCDDKNTYYVRKKLGSQFEKGVSLILQTKESRERKELRGLVSPLLIYTTDRGGKKKEMIGEKFFDGTLIDAIENLKTYSIHERAHLFIDLLVGLSTFHNIQSEEAGIYIQKDGRTVPMTLFHGDITGKNILIRFNKEKKRPEIAFNDFGNAGNIHLLAKPRKSDPMEYFFDHKYFYQLHIAGQNITSQMINYYAQFGLSRDLWALGINLLGVIDPSPLVKGVNEFILPKSLTNIDTLTFEECKQLTQEKIDEDLNLFFSNILKKDGITDEEKALIEGMIEITKNLLKLDHTKRKIDKEALQNLSRLSGETSLIG